MRHYLLTNNAIDFHPADVTSDHNWGFLLRALGAGLVILSTATFALFAIS